ncbi:YcnI family copper-binding membrane protein [Actinokineospora sp.]|uniref:YcnI family copper-binding membrane protein n=1 Tax=Actinokineospora sp. TaxID=1872133 RepID=UPI0040380D57
MSTNRFVARAGVVLTAAGIAVLSGGGIASAHVTAKVIGETATQGGYTKITFRVPNEDSAAGTVKLEIKLPAEYPLTSVRTKPTPGWTAQITKAKLDKPVTSHGAEITEAVSTVVWTAAPGTRIGPGEFGEFEVSAGRLPENTDKLVIPAIQTYDSGKVVAWDAPPPAEGAAEPERPAPVIALAKAAEGGDHHVTAVAPAGNDTGTGQTVAASTEDGTARWLGGAGLAVGALGLGLGAGATLRARRTVAAAKAGE